MIGGFFDPEFLCFWVDVEMSLRCWMNGGRVASCKDAWVKEDMQISPENPLFYIQLGEIYRKMHREDEAVSSFRKAIEVAPLSQAGYNALAFLYKEKGDEPRALAVLVEYLKCKKKHKPLFGN